MSVRQIVVSSRALGPRLSVTAKVYDTLAEMQEAAIAYHGRARSDVDEHTLGVTQVSRYSADNRICNVIVRLARGRLNTQIVSHEIHHAATALYGDQMPQRINTGAHLNHHNEPMAHLFSDLLCHLVDRLYALGYYS